MVRVPTVEIRQRVCPLFEDRPLCFVNELPKVVRSLDTTATAAAPKDGPGSHFDVGLNFVIVFRPDRRGSAFDERCPDDVVIPEVDVFRAGAAARIDEFLVVVVEQWLRLKVIRLPISIEKLQDLRGEVLTL